MNVEVSTTLLSIERFWKRYGLPLMGSAFLRDFQNELVGHSKPFECE